MLAKCDLCRSTQPAVMLDLDQYTAVVLLLYMYIASHSIFFFLNHVGLQIVCLRIKISYFGSHFLWFPFFKPMQSNDHKVKTLAGTIFISSRDLPHFETRQRCFMLQVPPAHFYRTGFRNYPSLLALHHELSLYSFSFEIVKNSLSSSSSWGRDKELSLRE